MCSSSAREVSGWLISPDGDCCYRFHHDPKSWKRFPFVYVDKWNTEGGTPSQMKSRERLPLDDALELCGQLLLKGWDKLGDQFASQSEVKKSQKKLAA